MPYPGGLFDQDRTHLQLMEKVLQAREQWLSDRGKAEEASREQARELKAKYGDS